jgi:glucuronate isomerase
MKRIELSAVQVTTLIDTLRYASHQMKLGVDTGADKEVVDELTETLLDFFKEGSFDCVLEKYVFWCPGCPDEDPDTIS